jgi:NADPH:quinone reductase-like Zn-dependent oxidoreductase
MGLKRVAGWIGGVAGGLIALAALAIFVAYWMSDNVCDADTGVQGDPMKAVVYCDYGPPDVLRIADVARPTPGDDELLVKIHAVAINPLDWHYLRGTPYIMRLDTGLRKPRVTRLGVDYSGTVEAVGRNVTRFQPGDEVFGGRNGALAEYITAREDRSVVLKPAELTFEQAASIPIAAVTALQGLRDKGNVQPGQSVLINGASGGVGTFAVQIAKSMGAEVTGVSSTRNLELVRSLGADYVIDYTNEDFTAGDTRYDVILDLVGNRSLTENRRVLKPDGIHVLIGGGGPDDGLWLGPLIGPIKALLYSPFVSQEFVMLLAELNKADLSTLADLIRAGTVTPVIDRRYDFSDTADAIRYLETSRARGKVIINME